jgi:hypothetical protein
LNVINCAPDANRVLTEEMQAYNPPLKSLAVGEVSYVNCVYCFKPGDRSSVRRNHARRFVCHDWTAVRAQYQSVGALCLDLDPGEGDEYAAESDCQEAC